MKEGMCRFGDGRQLCILIRVHFPSTGAMSGDLVALKSLILRAPVNTLKLIRDQGRPDLFSRLAAVMRREAGGFEAWELRQTDE
jgi:hypothetical protein